MGQNQAALWKAWCGLFLSRGHSQGTDPAFQMGLSNSRWTHAVTQNLEGFALLRKHGGILLHILREKGIRFIITPIVHGPFLGKGSWDDSDYPKFISVELSETGKVFPDKPPVVPATRIIYRSTWLRVSMVCPFHSTARWVPPQLPCPACSGSSWSERAAWPTIPVAPP